ncbi:MAG: hypothetical protein QW197_03530 [Candidatus Aenigmatarchaeota archaeon]
MATLITAITATGTGVNVDNITLELLNGVLRVKDGGITPTKLSFKTMRKLGDVILTSLVGGVKFITDLDVSGGQQYALLTIAEWSNYNSEASLYLRHSKEGDVGLGYGYQTRTHIVGTSISTATGSDHYLKTKPGKCGFISYKIVWNGGFREFGFFYSDNGPEFIVYQFEQNWTINRLYSISWNVHGGYLLLGPPGRFQLYLLE